MYVVFTNALFAFLRMYKSANLLINGGFVFCATLQGTWLIHMGVALYGHHPLDEENSSKLSSEFMAGCFFHFLLIAFSMLFLYTLLFLYFSYVGKRRKTLFQPLDSCDDPAEAVILLKDMSQEQVAA